MSRFKPIGTVDAREIVPAHPEHLRADKVEHVQRLLESKQMLGLKKRPTAIGLAVPFMPP